MTTTLFAITAIAWLVGAGAAGAWISRDRFARLSLPMRIRVLVTSLAIAAGLAAVVGLLALPAGVHYFINTCTAGFSGFVGTNVLCQNYAYPP